MMLAVPRSVFALARDGFLPRRLAHVNERTGVPTNSVIVYGIIVAVIAASGTFSSLIIIANVGALLMYLLCILAVFGLRKKNIRLEGEPFTVPGGAVVPWLAAAAVIALLTTVTLAEFKAIGIALGVATALYIARLRIGTPTA
jgi:APA family basic amino acid/polyamine antiporter